MTDEERTKLQAALGPEYALLGGLLSTTWSASLTRTSIFLFTLSSAGVALGFAAQAGIDRGYFRDLALVVLPIVLFIGVTTFIRVVQLQRESVVYLTGLNRIRRLMQDGAPGSAPYYVLPRNDDVAAIFSGPGTGMPGHAPRFRLLNLVSQTQGVVGIVTAAVAAAFAGLAVAPLGSLAVVILAGAAFLVTLVVLFTYWQRSIAEIVAAREPMFPTPSRADPGS